MDQIRHLAVFEVLSGRQATIRRVGPSEVLALLLKDGSVNRLLKDGLLLVDVKLSLELANVLREIAAIGATTCVGEGEVLVNDFPTYATPVTLTPAILLDLLRVDASVSVLSKKSGHMLNGDGGALGDALVVTVVGLVRAGHVEEDESGRFGEREFV